MENPVLNDRFEGPQIHRWTFIMNLQGHLQAFKPQTQHFRNMGLQWQLEMP